MTVREQLLFAGRLKNPTMDAEAVRAKAEGILRELGIDDIADQYVGGSSSIRGISGGEVGADFVRRARTPRLSR
jgi:ABC-type multidrug transport system ATPase subunit